MLDLKEVDDFWGIQLAANAVLRDYIAHRLTRALGRQSLTKLTRLYEDFL